MSPEVTNPLKKVSVVVPVYNTEAFLVDCLDSLVNQTLDEIEIIVVNDGSPDDSQAIIDDYAADVLPTEVGDLATLDAALTDRGIAVIDLPAWQQLDAHERALGAAAGRPRIKLVSRDEQTNWGVSA